jgi:hypothetical protein
MIIPLCLLLGSDAAVIDGASKIDGSISGIVGAQKASMAKQRPGMDLPALSGAV